MGEGSSLNAAMSDALHLPAGNTDDHGALVASVETDGPASHAGVTPGDVIVGGVGSVEAAAATVESKGRAKRAA